MRHLPQGVVRRMFFTGQPLSSEEAMRFGFLDSVHDSAELAAAAMARARGIATHSPQALRLGKAALNESEPLPVQEGYAVEQRYTLRLARTADAREALAARREKRLFVIEVLPLFLCIGRVHGSPVRIPQNSPRE